MSGSVGRMSPRRLSLVRGAVRRGWAVTALLATLALVLAAVAALSGWQAWDGRRTRAEMMALEAGRDRPVPSDARRELLLARADFLLTRGMVDEAEALIDPVTRAGHPGSLAALLYNLGNGRLRKAFDAISDRKIDEASSNVRVAKEHYRRSLAIEPGAFDAKVNLDLAMRLVRDFPEREGQEEEGQTEPKNLWTDLPGLPKGLP